MGYCSSLLMRSMNSTSAMEAGTPAVEEEGRAATTVVRPSAAREAVVKVATDP
jgi:hypothetical protein